ncbi:MAG TPA: carboxymuconolactone decarboxylase family protein [Flavipsychrobacter sp.]|nr:carboxymuconolactone decarboxylase family protein [Flavipsychrobacter sp.]
MDISQNETVVNFFTDLGIDLTHTSHSLQVLVAADSRFLRDLKLNVSSVLGSSNMTRKEAYLLALSVAVNQKHEVLMKAFEKLAKNEGTSDAEIAETHACTGVMNVNNAFYRFRHYMAGVEYYESQPAGLRMSVMMNPVLGKEFFELMSIVVSALNGCERCVTSHESSVKQHGATEPRIYDAIRLGAVIKSLCLIF